MVIGVPLGVLTGRDRFARHILEPVIMAMYSAPVVALLPLIIVWFGIGLWSKAVLIFLGTVFALIISTEAGVAGVDRRLVETAQSFTATRLQVLTKIVLPSAIPVVLAGVRLAIGRVLVMIVVAGSYRASK
jgi:ABC-type nitrate/sulfonate/bicarbonate transport system permease component